MTTQEALLLLAITVGVFFMPLLSERIGWFTAPCEMLYGAVIANALPFVQTQGSFISALSQFGFLLLLFLVGLELDFTALRQRGRGMLIRAVIAAVGIQALALVVVVALHWPPINALLLGTLSVSLLLVVLHQQQLSHSDFGQTILVVGAIGEFLSIVELTGYDLVSQYGLNWMLALAAVKLLALLLAGYVALRALDLVASRQPTRFRRLFALGDPAELGVRASLALMLCFTAIAVLLRVEQILAAFIAGAICSFVFRRRNSLTRKLVTMGQGFFVPIFFITVGLGLRVGAILNGDSLRLVAQLLVALVAIRLLAIPLLRLAGFAWRETLPAALLLSSPLTLLVAIAQVGVALGQLNANTLGTTLAMAIAGGVIFPLLARPLMKGFDAQQAPKARSGKKLPRLRRGRGASATATVPALPPVLEETGS